MALYTGSHWAIDRAYAGRFESLSPEQEAQLAERLRAGDTRAAGRLVQANLRHVVAIAHEYRRWGVPIDDLVQQGCMGLLKAAQRFDPAVLPAEGNPDRGSGSLRAYAAYWIRAEIRDYVVRGYRIVRLGTTRTERRALRAYRTRAVRTVDELAEQSGMPKARCEQLWPLLVQGDRSLDFAVDGRLPGRELLRDEHPGPEARAIRQEECTGARERVEQALATLSDRERRILWARLAADEPETLAQVGKRLGVSRERVRQLESRARETMRVALGAA
jgi:RNA polymerase sigma-32 factor